MAGIDVTRANLDQKSAEAILHLRDAFERVTAVSTFLATLPSDAPGGDPLTLPTNDPNVPGRFGYTVDEAYLLRSLFEQLHALPVQALLDTGRKLTGLQ